jgi:hypothetical protein
MLGVMTDLAASAPVQAVSSTSPATRSATRQTDAIGGLWMVLVTAVCAFGALGVTRNPTLFVAMAAIAGGSLMMGRAVAGVDHRTRRSLRLLQTLGMVCCLTVVLTLFS